MSKTQNVLVLKTDGTHEVREVTKGLEGLQSVVGGYIETVHLPHFKGQVYANEEGLLVGLPPNPWGSRIGYAQPLVGDLVVCYSSRDATEDDLANVVGTPAQRERTRAATGGFWY